MNKMQQRVASAFFFLWGFLGLFTAAHAANPQVELETSQGKIVIELNPEAAPNTVENFLQYVRSGQYDGTQFHRVIKGFMIQGGGYTADYKEKPTKAPIKNEAEKSVKAGLKNEPYTIAMARTADPHSATAQFFINVANNTFLNWGTAADQWGYCVFGKVTSGMEIVDAIAGGETGAGGPFPRDVPKTAVLIKKARVLGDASTDTASKTEETKASATEPAAKENKINKAKPNKKAVEKEKASSAK